MKKSKEIIYISIATVFVLASAVIIIWIVKDQKDGKKSLGNGSDSVQMDDGQQPDSAEGIGELKDEPVVVTNKEEAQKVVSDIDSAIGSMGNELE